MDETKQAPKTPEIDATAVGQGQLSLTEIMRRSRVVEQALLDAAPQNVTAVALRKGMEDLTAAVHASEKRILEAIAGLSKPKA